METLRHWALTVAVSAVAGAIINMLSPKGSLGKSVRTAVSLFMLIAMLAPFVGETDFSDFLSFSEAEYSENDISDTVKNEIKASVEAEIRKILSDCGIKSADVSIDITVDKGTVTVGGIEIEADGSAESMKAAEKRIKDEIGADVSIGVKE